jgi:endonuclease YncB( thermonuclease family)
VPTVDAESSGVVSRVTDGDSIEVDAEGVSTRVRLVAINTPDQGECFADTALAHLAEIDGATVRLEVMGTDQFGRTLAHVFEGDRHLNLELVREGLAVASTPDADDPYGQALLDAEDDAYAERTGLWGAEACGGSGEPPAVSFDVTSSVVDPVGPDDQNLGAEIVFIENRGNETVALDGWSLRDESTRHRYVFPEDSPIGPGEVIGVASDDPGWDPGGGPVWNNGGDLALLLDPMGTVVARWRY